MNKKVKNIVSSVQQRLLNLSKERGEDPNYIFIKYAIERLLYRMSCSSQTSKFILKGAMLLATWMEKTHRPTKDLDLLGFGDASDDALAAIFREICNTKVEPDGIEFKPGSIQISEIREELEYPGKRVKIESRLGNARTNIQVDIGFGDSIIPAPKIIDYPTLLDMPSPRILAYPVETVIAEKLESIVLKGILNSRMKDFYDLRLISKSFPLDGNTLTKAIGATFNRRGTSIPLDCPIAFTNEFFSNSDKQTQWRAFLRTSKLENIELELFTVIEDIREFLLLPLIAAANKNTFRKSWPAGGPWK